MASIGGIPIGGGTSPPVELPYIVNNNDMIVGSSSVPATELEVDGKYKLRFFLDGVGQLFVQIASISGNRQIETIGHGAYGGGFSGNTNSSREKFTLTTTYTNIAEPNWAGLNQQEHLTLVDTTNTTATVIYEMSMFLYSSETNKGGMNAYRWGG